MGFFCCENHAVESIKKQSNGRVQVILMFPLCCMLLCTNTGAQHVTRLPALFAITVAAVNWVETQRGRRWRVNGVTNTGVVRRYRVSRKQETSSPEKEEKMLIWEFMINYKSLSSWEAWMRHQGHVVILLPWEKGRVRDDHKGESSVHAVWQDVTHTADAVETPWNRLSQSHTGKFATVESWFFVVVSPSRAGVSSVWDFWAATNSWAVTGHSRIRFIRGERDGSRRATHLCDSSHPPVTLAEDFFLQCRLTQTVPHLLFCFVFDTNLLLGKQS